MSEVLEKSVKEKAVKEVVKKKKPVKTKHKLRDFYGCFKGKIFYDDDVFGFAI